MSEFTCPECGESYAIKAKLVGKRVLCRECGAPSRVTADEEPPTRPTLREQLDNLGWLDHEAKHTPDPRDDSPARRFNLWHAVYAAVGLLAILASLHRLVWSPVPPPEPEPEPTPAAAPTPQGLDPEQSARLLRERQEALRRARPRARTKLEEAETNLRRRFKN